MAQKTVWAYKRIKELDYKIGYVACDAILANRLIDAGAVQDARHYGMKQKPLDPSWPTESATHETHREPKYAHKEMTAKEKRAHSSKDEK